MARESLPQATIRDRTLTDIPGAIAATKAALIAL